VGTEREVTAPKPWRRRVSRSGAVPLCFVTDAPQLAAGSFTFLRLFPFYHPRTINLHGRMVLFIGGIINAMVQLVIDNGFRVFTRSNYLFDQSNDI
jgi:hypothetical protein